ncbi:MAG: hypothetical protein ABIM59_04955 [candidate division WOR-3 bacterium]
MRIGDLEFDDAVISQAARYFNISIDKIVTEQETIDKLEAHFIAESILRRRLCYYISLGGKIYAIVFVKFSVGDSYRTARIYYEVNLEDGAGRHGE